MAGPASTESRSPACRNCCGVTDWLWANWLALASVTGSAKAATVNIAAPMIRLIIRPDLLGLGYVGTLG
jgi:hypothetical protein